MRATASRLGRAARSPRLVPLWLALAVWVLLAAAGGSRPGRALERRGFDLLARRAAPGASRLPITIVGIDEASFAELRLSWPWPRSLHARLAERLTAAGAAVVAFDVLFAEPTEPAEDAALAEAVRATGTVVLAADLVYQETRHARQWLRVDPIPALKEAGARTGLAGVTFDPDAVVRELPVYADAFWREVLRRFAETRPGLIPPPPEPPPGALLRWIGPDHSFPYVSYYQALDPDAFLPAGAFQDQIVLIGRDVRASPEAGAAQADSFATPFTGATGWLTPGVEIHATAIENVVAGLVVRPLPRFAELALLAAAVAFSLVAMRPWHPARAAAAGIAALAALAYGDLWLLRARGVWLPAAAAAAAIPLCYVAFGGWEYLRERRQRRLLRAAFGHYLSPAVLEQILAHPERLALGGERREVTLLFTDLAGFTSVAERLSPEDVAHLLNRHLTEMTGIVLRSGGTLDKFIGDAVMAFWGAPLADAAHADHAVAAAEAMQERMATLRAELAARGLPELHMRIGLNSGAAVVGNMGSEERFEYTAIGDNVNLASRLEGVNKLYGTGILLSEATAAALSDRSRLRPVDKVRVKGKQLPVEVYTVDPRPAVRERTREAILAYRAREWDGAEALWREVAALAPGDPVADVYLARIARFRAEPPAADWDGAATLDKL